MRLFLFLALFTAALFAENLSKNILILDEEAGLFSKGSVPRLSGYRYHIYEPFKLQEEVITFNDTMILFQSVAARLDSGQKKLIVDWIREGGKLIFMNKNTPETNNRFNWLPYGYQFTTNSSAAKGEGPAKLAKIAEYDYLTKSLDIDAINTKTNAFSDANVMIAHEHYWNSAVVTTNVNGTTGPVVAYSKYGKGMLLFCGVGLRDIGTSAPLTALYRTLIELPWDPDPLPYTNASSVDIPPPLVKISGMSSGKVDLAWKTPAWLKGIRGYRIYRSTDEGETKELIGDVHDRNIFQDANATDGVTYAYYVTSYDDMRDSPFSQAVVATPPGEVVSDEILMLVTPDGNVTSPLTALTTTDNFDHITGDALNTSQKVAGDPVSLATGGFYLSAEDIKLPGGIPALRFARSYNSIFKESSEAFRMGNGWRHNYMISIYPNPNGSINVKWGDGHTDIYLKADDDGKTISYKPASNRVYATLNKTRGVGYALTLTKGLGYFFSEEGVLSKIETANGRKLLFDYEGDKLVKVSDPLSGRFLSLEYDNENLSRVCAMAKACAEYSFDEKNNLTGVKELDGNRISYLYDEKFQMTASLDSKENRLFENRYKNGQVVLQKDALGRETHFAYLPGGVTSVTDREGRVSKYRHDSLGRLTEETDPLGRTLVFEYNTKGEVIKRIAKDGTFKAYEYDDAGNRVVEKDELGNVRSMEYDDRGNLVGVIDENGFESRMEYDTFGNRIRVTDSEGNSIAYSYDENGNLQTIRYANGGEVVYRYDQNGYLSAVTDAEGNTKAFRYNSLGQKTVEVDELGNETRFEYDAKGRTSRITDANGYSVSYSYDGFGNMTAKTDPNGLVTEYTYNETYRLVKKTDSLGRVTQYAYSNEGNLLSTTDPKGNTVRYEYDPLNRKVAVIASDGNRSVMRYNLKGKMISFTDALNHKISMTYDRRGKLTTSTSATKSSSSTEYTPNAMAKTITDPLGRKKAFVYDKNNRVVAVIDEMGQRSKNSYDANGNRLATVMANGKAVRYTYNKNNQLIAIEEPGKETTRFVYDARKTLSQVLFPSGGMIAFSYDKTGRLIAKTDGNETIAHTLDANGNKLTTRFDTNSTITRTFDPANRLLSRKDQFGNTVAYEYDPAGNLAALTYSDGKRVTYAYDSLNRLVGVTDFNALKTRYEYQADGKLSKVHSPDGSIVTYRYDADGRLIGREERMGKEVLASYAFELDAAGQRTGETRREPMLRLFASSSETFSYGPDNRMNGSDKWKLRYDKDGNLVEKRSASETIRLKYDGFGRLSAKNKKTFGYDGENLRSTITENGRTYRLVYDTHSGLDKLLEIQDENGKILRRFVYGLGLVSFEDSGNSYVYHYNTKGSTIALTDMKGTIVSAYSYDIYGEVMSQKGDMHTRFTYNGQYGVMDDGDGMFFMRTREYDATLMRFIQKDKILLGTVINSQSLNRYAYVEGDPIRGIDPMGAWFLGDDVLVSGLGALIEIAKQVVSDFVEGEVSSVETYVAAAVKGATKAQVLLYTANASLAEASGTFAGDIAKQGLEVASGKREELDYKGALSKAAKSAVSVGLFDPGATKVATGFDEAFKQVESHAVSNIKSIAPKVTELFAPEKVSDNAEASLSARETNMQNSDVKLLQYK